ncbi:MAG: DUF4230 domain-containing protein [Candidatus Peribacteria bacterium]|nr:MAG: DUF4230 domain-containing protein [Candidatus Peribacteria bacterium]
MLKTIRRIITILLLGFIATLLWKIVQQNKTQLVIDDRAPLIVQQLRAVQRLETTEMKVTKILKGEQELSDYLPGFDRDNIVSDFLFGESVSMEIYGTVTAGFDLSQLTTGAIISVGTGLVDIQLPSAEILHVSLDPETQVFDRDLGVLNKGDATTETKLRNQALDIVREAAIQQ